MIIIPSALIDTIKQTSGGTTIQASYGGLQLHKKAYQRKKKSVGQQRVRAVFTSVQSSWRNLTPEQIDTWNAAADPGISGFQLYSSTNNILVGFSGTGLTEYTMPVTPPTPVFDLTSQTYIHDPDEPVINILWSGSGGATVADGWWPRILFSGWISPSVTRFPPPKLLWPQDSANTWDEDEINFQAYQGEFPDAYLPQEGQKCLVDLSYINLNTGQIVPITTTQLTATF